MAGTWHHRDLKLHTLLHLQQLIAQEFSSRGRALKSTM